MKRRSRSTRRTLRPHQYRQLGSQMSCWISSSGPRLYEARFRRTARRQPPLAPLSLRCVRMASRLLGLKPHFLTLLIGLDLLLAVQVGLHGCDNIRINAVLDVLLRLFGP